MKIEGDFGSKIVSKMELNMPTRKIEIFEKYGNKIVAFEWDFDRSILLKDLLNYVACSVFNSKFELAGELSKAYRRFKYEKLDE